MNKTELFRKINASSPEIVECLINFWGSQQFNAYLGELFKEKNAEAKPGISTETCKLLAELKLLHGQEYPQYVEHLSLEVPDKLSANSNFQIISARFPKIASRICDTWGGKNFSSFINELLQDTRDGHRQGFPAEVMVALFHLMQEHDLEYPQFVRKVTDIWSVDNKP